MAKYSECNLQQNSVGISFSFQSCFLSSPAAAQNGQKMLLNKGFLPAFFPSSSLEKKAERRVSRELVKEVPHSTPEGIDS